MTFDPQKHAQRYFNGLCVCKFPVASKHDSMRCAVCGGLLPITATPEYKMAQEQMVISNILGVLALIALAIWLWTLIR